MNVMTKSKKKKTALIILIVSLFIVVLSGILFLLVYNSNSSKEARMQKRLEEAWNIEISDDAPEFFKAFDEKSYFKVTDISDDGQGHFTVTADVTSPDIYQAIIDYQNSITYLVSYEEMDSALTQIINDADLKTTEQTVVFIETDGEDVVQFSEDFVDAMYGYAYKYSMEQFTNATVC